MFILAVQSFLPGNERQKVQCPGEMFTRRSRHDIHIFFFGGGRRLAASFIGSAPFPPLGRLNPHISGK